MATFGILVGGGPAPGINGVIGSAAIHAARSGARVVGLLDGFKWLMQGDVGHTRELQPEDVAQIHLEGGSILHTSRANPTKNEGDLERVVDSLDRLGIDHLVTIGGDDTSFSARRVAQTAAGRIRVVHVPKTIDNDLPLPPGVPTFGFETAREQAAHVVQALVADCRSTHRWFFVIMMGRTAGHLALGAGLSGGAAVTVIPEEFPGDRIGIDALVRVVEGAIVKRLSQGRDDGVAVIAEGVAERFDPDDPILKDAPRDEHGHVRLAEVPLGKVLRTAVGESLASRGVKIALGEKDVGYELRCVPPTAFDRDYTRDLGVGAVRALLAGTSEAMITRQHSGIVAVPFEEIVDAATGRTQVRQVDIRTDSYANARALQVRIEPEDLSDPAKLAAIAQAAGLSPDEARARYGGLA
ncbi:MAG: 6-phosphofructokinase [Deltaproteobacteria bacterium]|nr:6-phosphofructokinase [Deltaproteobacteria bacterium]